MGRSACAAWGCAYASIDRETATLLLDTGASGMSLSPKAGRKGGSGGVEHARAPRRRVSATSAVRTLCEYLAPEVRIGDVTFANYPVSVFRSAQNSDFDGLMGADVFQRFIVSIDFVRMELTLDARPKVEPAPGDEHEDADNAPGARLLSRHALRQSHVHFHLGE